MPRPPKGAPKPDRLFERDSRLFQKCQNKCGRTGPVEEFAPRTDEATLETFLQAAVRYQETQSAEARATVVQHVTAYCDVCRDSIRRSQVKRNKLRSTSKKAKPARIDDQFEGDKYGTWRPVPGYPEIHASSLGYVRKPFSAYKKSRFPRLGYAKDGYLFCFVNIRVHRLVCFAFHGEPPDPAMSVDHINGKRGDNRACNLRWATTTMQRANKGKQKQRSDCRPVYVWQVGNVKPNVPYNSCHAAAKALGLQTGNISRVARGECESTQGYYATYNDDNGDLEGEVWKEFTESLHVSNYGRVQRLLRKKYWQRKHYPESFVNGYPVVGSNGKSHLLHPIVGTLFFIGPKPKGWTQWDHKDRNRRNCAAWNLRPVTIHENAKNTLRYKGGTNSYKGGTRQYPPKRVIVSQS